MTVQYLRIPLTIVLAADDEAAFLADEAVGAGVEMFLPYDQCLVFSKANN